MSQWGGVQSPPKSPTSAHAQQQPPSPSAKHDTHNITTHFFTPNSLEKEYAPPSPSRASPSPARNRADSRPSSRPLSMVQTYQPPLMEVAQDTLPELQPIFTFLNSHSNKLYQEGYFLKLNDLD